MLTTAMGNMVPFDEKVFVFLKKTKKRENCRYAEAWHIVAATCRGPAAGRHARRQDRQYHS
jgi:hypothetical protein